MIENPHQHDAGSLRGIWKWVDPQFGIIRAVSGTHMISPNLRWWVYVCELARAPVGTWHSLSDFSAAGCSIDPHEALRRAFGEAVERYCGLAEIEHERRILLRPSDNELTKALPLCAPDEPCPETFRNWNVDTPLTHFMMRRLSDGGSVPVPAGYVSLSFTPGSGEPLITLPISTGLAFHTSLCMAIWRGICEAAERDAMMLMWWTRRVAHEIDVDSELPESISGRLERLKSANLRGRIFDITTDFRISTVFCVVCSDHYPYFVVGASCHEDPAAACAKALDEAASGRVALRCEKWSIDVPSFDDFDWVQRLEHHMVLYARWRNAPALDFLLNGNNETLSFNEFARQPWRKPPRDMSELTRFSTELETEGLDVLWMDLTSGETADIGFAVKVFVPQMMPLSQDHRARWLGTPRLLRAAGLEEAASSSFNSFPHPFA